MSSAPDLLSTSDDVEELLDVISERNDVIGQCDRGTVHSEGLLHRSVHVFVRNESGSFLLQRRSSRKGLEPGRWDLSCAEHLKSGESYEDAAIRGLKEELGISADKALLTRIRDAYRYHESYPSKGLEDNEIIETYLLTDFSGNIVCDPSEVSETKYWSSSDIFDSLRSRPEEFTCWFRNELQSIDLSSL